VERWLSPAVKPSLAINRELRMDILKNPLFVGLGAVVAATVLAPTLVPALGNAGRPLLKSLLKSGLVLYEKGREAFALAGESMEDMMAEIHAEAAEKSVARSATPAPHENPMGHAGNGAGPTTTIHHAEPDPAAGASGV
jgi:hypothetical protein